MDNDEHQQQQNVLRNIIHIAGSNLYRHFLGFITTLFRPTLLGPELYGLWSLLNVLPKYANFGHLGSRTAMRYQIPTFHSHHADRQSQHQLTLIKHSALLTALGSNVLIALLACGYGLFFATGNEASIGWTSFAIVILLECLNDHLVSELNGHQKFILVSRMTYSRYTLNFLLTGIFIYYWGFYGALAALLLSALFSLLYLGYYCRLDLPLQVNRNTLVRQIKTGAPIVALDLVNLGLRSIDKLFVAFFMGTQALGYYALGSMLVGPIMNIPGASRVVTEQLLMSKHTQLSQQQQLDDYLFKPLRYNAYLMPLLIGAVYLCIPVFIGFLLPKYHAAILPSQLLMTSTYFAALSYPSHGLIVANQWQKQAAKIASLALLFDALLIGCSIYLDHQLIGVAISSVIGFFVFAGTLILFIVKQFTQDISRYLLRWCELLIPFAIMWGILFAIESLVGGLTLHPVWLALISLLLFALGYFPILYYAKRHGRFSSTKKQS